MNRQKIKKVFKIIESLVDITPSTASPKVALVHAHICFDGKWGSYIIFNVSMLSRLKEGIYEISELRNYLVEQQNISKLQLHVQGCVVRPVKRGRN